MNTFDKKVHKVRGSLEFLSHFYLTVDVESIGFEKKLPFRIEYENLSPGIIGALLYETDCKCHKFVWKCFSFYFDRYSHIALLILVSPRVSLQTLFALSNYMHCALCCARVA